MVWRHIEPKTAFLAEGITWNQFLAFVTFIFPLFIQLECVIDINGQPKLHYSYIKIFKVTKKGLH